MTIPVGNKAIAMSRYKLENTLVSYDSQTTADGVGRTTLIDTSLIGQNDFITDQVAVLILGGANNQERRNASAFDPATGTITWVTAMTAQVTAGTPYRLIAITTL
jgi:hypothetical protein